MKKRPFYDNNTPGEPGILVVDSSVAFRSILRDVLMHMPGAFFAGEAGDHEEAIREIRLKSPDIVLLSSELSLDSDLEALRRIIRLFPGISVSLVSRNEPDETNRAILALERGVLDLLPRPSGTSPDKNRRMLEQGLARLVRLYLDKSRGVPTEDTSSCAGSPEDGNAEIKTAIQTDVRKTSPPSNVEFIVIGASTGGPKALMDVIPGLPANLAAPVIIVQHMPTGFTDSLANQLDRHSLLKVVEARDGHSPVPGEVILAPGGRHIKVESREGRIQLSLKDGPPENGARPSFDVLLRSLARIGNISLVTITMTGMGEDGADGICLFSRERSYNIIQQADTCTVPGMPSAVLARGAADEIVPLDELAGRISALVGSKPELPEVIQGAGNAKAG